MGSGEEEDGGDDVEEVEDGGGEHQPVEVPLHDRAGGEVEQAAQVSKEAKEADDHLSGNKWENNNKLLRCEAVKLDKNIVFFFRWNQEVCLLENADVNLLLREARRDPENA